MEKEAKETGILAYRSACNILKITPAQNILKNLSSSKLILKHRNIGPTGAKSLAAALSKNATIEILDLEDNGLESEGSIFISKMLLENATINTLNLSSNNISSIGAIALAEVLQKNNSILHLNLSNNNFHDSDSEILADAIEKNEKIITLNLSHNHFSEKGADLFGLALGVNNSIEKLNLSWNEFRKQSVSKICVGLKRNYCISSIDLSWNGLDVEGSLAICDLLRGNKYLRELNICNNRINWEGAFNVSKGLKENDTLEVLLIGYNPLSMSGLLDILDAIENSQSTLKYVGFENIPVNPRIVYVIEVLQRDKNISFIYGEITESFDVYGRKLVSRNDPLKFLIQFLSDKKIKPHQLFLTVDADKTFKVTKDQFIAGLKLAKVPLEESEFEKLLLRFDANGKEGKINYQRLSKGVRDQMRQTSSKRKGSSPNHSTKMKDISLKPNQQENFLLSKFDELSFRSTPSPTLDIEKDENSEDKVNLQKDKNQLNKIQNNNGDKSDYSDSSFDSDDGS